MKLAVRELSRRSHRANARYRTADVFLFHIDRHRTARTFSNMALVDANCTLA